MRMIIILIVLLAVLAVCCEAQDNFKWIDAKTLQIEGKGWNDTESYFDRLPARADKDLPTLNWLARRSTGMAIRFATNTTKLKLRWTLEDMPNVLPHQADTGTSGLDLYILTKKGDWRWMAIAKPENKLSNEVTLFESSKKERNLLLYLPLFNKPVSLEIGIDKDSDFKIIKPENNTQIVIYGTSIVNAIAASRPGMAYPAIIGRKLHCEVMNLGFSGSAHMEPALCNLLAELNPAVYVIDALPNMGNDPITERTLNLVKTIRKARPETPIVLVEHIYLTYDEANESDRSYENNCNKQLRAAYEQLLKEKIKGLFYVEAKGLLGDDEEGTVDGWHPTDLGFFRMADAIGKAAKEALDSRLPKSKAKTTVPNF